eukprot:8380262-Heterocapsa_arctica.AAC.1
MRVRALVLLSSSMTPGGVTSLFVSLFMCLRPRRVFSPPETSVSVRTLGHTPAGPPRGTLAAS